MSAYAPDRLRAAPLLAADADNLYDLMSDEEQRAARSAGVPEYILRKCCAEVLLQTGLDLTVPRSDSCRSQRPALADAPARDSSVFDSISAARPRCVGLAAGANPRLQAELQKLVDRRQICRRLRDFVTADRLRLECATRQVRVDDDSLTWYGPGHTGGDVNNPDPRHR